MTRYIFGNVVQTVPVIATINAGDAILTLAGLGFLGVGIEPTAAADWGHDLNTAVQNDVSNGFWWSGVYPGVAIALLVLGVTLVGESLNDVLNPLLRTAKITKVILPSRNQDQGRERVSSAEAARPRRPRPAGLVRRARPVRCARSTRCRSRCGRARCSAWSASPAAASRRSAAASWG